MEAFLEHFMKKNGPVIPGPTVPPATVAAWRGRMPELVLTWWQEVGFAGLADGLVWFTDPGEWTEIAADFIPISQVVAPSVGPIVNDGPYYPWLRTAFGEMFCWSPTHGAALTISPMFRQLGGHDYTRDISDGMPEIGLEYWMLADRTRFDETDEDDKPLFPRLLGRLGPVGPDTMYALTPAVVAGGLVVEENFSIEPAEAHLAVLASL